jgi:hypothetical protein
MLKNKALEALYHMYLTYLTKPRLSNTELHRLHSPYKAAITTSYLLKKAREEFIFVGPFIYCNSGITVDFVHDSDDPLTLLDQAKKDPAVTRAVTLYGEYAFLCFKKGATFLTYAEVISPTLHSDFRMADIELTEKGSLPVDPYPRCWDELDWKIYHLMRNPNISYPKVSAQLGREVTWKTVATRYKKIVESCKVMMGFFPHGMNFYSQTFLTFKTGYEVNLREELQKLDRTSYLYKIKDTILLNLFLDNTAELNIFVKLRKEGLIYDLKVSIPVSFWTPFSI